MLKMFMPAFDPLGFFSPPVVTFKILMQDLWRNKIDWDDEVSEDMQIRWALLLDELIKINEIRIARRYGS